MHMNRTHRVDAAFVADCFDDERGVNLRYTKTDDQAADICTKRFYDSEKWLSLLYLVSIVTDGFWKATSLEHYTKGVFESGYPAKSGGAHKPWIGLGGLKDDGPKRKKLTKAQKGRPTRAQLTSGKSTAAAEELRDDPSTCVPPSQNTAETEDASSDIEECSTPGAIAANGGSPLLVVHHTGARPLSSPHHTGVRPLSTTRTTPTPRTRSATCALWARRIRCLPACFPSGWMSGRSFTTVHARLKSLRPGARLQGLNPTTSPGARPPGVSMLLTAFPGWERSSRASAFLPKWTDIRPPKARSSRLV